MQLLRRLAPIFLAAGVVSGLAVPVRALDRPAMPVGLTGIARDAAGRVLADVEILLVAERGATEPIARARTDVQGRFHVSGLPSGVYRLAAVKDGYLASLTRVHTAVRSSIDLVLNPIPRPGEPGSETVMENLSWVLRVPRRSLLRELDPEALLAQGALSESAGERLSSIPDDLQAELMHRVAVAGLGGRKGDRSPLEGTETRMQIASLVGERANLRLEGVRESYLAGGDESFPVGETRKRTDTLAMDVSVDAGNHSSVDVTAYYRDAAVAVGNGVDPQERDTQRSWGYDATWAMQLDAASRLAVQLDYLDQAFETGEPEVPWRGSSNRSIGAETGYEVLADENHLIRVGFRAQRLDLALPLVRSGGEPSAFLGVSGAAGWSATLDVEDSWVVGSSTTFLYGMGVRQALDEVDSTLVVPRAGAAWSGRRLEVRGVVSYHTVPAGASEPFDSVPLPGQIRLERPIGYEVRVAAPLGSGWTATAEYHDEPVQPAYLGLRGNDRAEEPYYLSNGNVADRRGTLAIERPGSFGTFSMRFTGGQAEGFVTDRYGWGAPVRILANRDLRYRAAAAEVTFRRSGTGLAVEWVEIAERIPGATGEAAWVRQVLDAEFQQDLVRFGFMDARCRLVVAARVGRDGGVKDDDRDRALLALQQRLSAGVAVLF